MDPKPPRPRAPSRPEIIDLTPETPVRNARRWDDPKPVELPPPPAVPGEFQPTMMSPASTPDAASAAALRRKLEDAERRARDAEAKQAAAEKRASSLPAGDPLGDEAVGKLVKAVVSALTKRFGAPLVLATCLAGGGYALKAANEKPAPPPLTAAEFSERVDKFETRVTGRLDSLTRSTNVTIDMTRCMRKKTNQIGESLLPAPDRMGPARRPAAYEDDCPESPGRLPEPK